MPLNDSSIVSVSDGQMSLALNAATGRATLLDANNRPLLINAAAGFALSSESIIPNDERYSRSVSVFESPEPILPGRTLSLKCKDSQGILDLEWRITMLRELHGAVFEIVARNVSGAEAQVVGSEPLRLTSSENSGCLFSAVGDENRVLKALTNGRIYYDPGQLFDFTQNSPDEIQSNWNIAIHIPETRDTLVFGYLDNNEAEGTFSAGWTPDDETKKNGAFNITAHSMYNDCFMLLPGEQISSGRMLVILDDNPFTPLETFAALSSKLHDVHLNPIINGWCSWFPYYNNINEQEVLKNAEFIARELKPYGMEYVQIDDGYQTAFGDWEGNSQFPNGMKGIADEIRKLGLKPGIWIAPYAVSAQTDIAKEHPAWLAHNINGEVQPITPDHQMQAQYILDITHPEARQWLSDMFQKLTGQWGYEFIKTDFVEWTILAAEKYHIPSFSKSMAYRLGCEVMRQAAGPDCHILDCGPAPMALGLVDSMRIENDRPDPPFPVWEHYWGWYNSAIPAAAKRYYFHQHMWINDPDHLRVRELTIPQAQAAASIIALSGGTVISGDRLYDLPADRIEIIKKALPAYGMAARPLDLFENPMPEIFALNIDKPFGCWLVTGCLNGGSEPVSRKLKLSDLGLASGKKHLVYEFWTQEFIGEFTDSIQFDIPPTAIKLFAIREKHSVPQILSTDRHITQGAIELIDVHWDDETNTLSGTALGKPGIAWTIVIYVPSDYTWDRNCLPTEKNTEAAFETPLLRARFEFQQAESIDWAFKFRRRQPNKVTGQNDS